MNNMCPIKYKPVSFVICVFHEDEWRMSVPLYAPEYSESKPPADQGLDIAQHRDVVAVIDVQMRWKTTRRQLQKDENDLPEEGVEPSTFRLEV